MISREELNPKNYPLTDIQAKNFELLFEAMNKLRTAYGKPMIVTSGVRSKEDQERINPQAPNSAHRQAGACDISDPTKDLWGWCLDNFQVIIDCGLYMEQRMAYMRHCHFQIIPPKSGHRLFLA